MNLEITPRVTYEGEVVLDLALENSALGRRRRRRAASSIPSFTSRKVHTLLRLREGESNLLAGLIRQDTSANDPEGCPG